MLKLLIIGDWPGFFGGVTNYTRPLAERLARVCDVHYLYNSSRTENYDIFGERIVYRSKTPSGYTPIELISGRALQFNYDNLDLDTSHWFDEMFVKILSRVKPDVIHINEIFGFSSQIISIARERRIPVVVSVHEYWWLCPHRVMVDFNKVPCEGPLDLSTCAFCVENKVKGYSSRKMKLRFKAKKYLPRLYHRWTEIKAGRAQRTRSTTPGKDELSRINVEKVKTPLLEQLDRRLRKNIDALNSASLVICVSSDVKRHLSRFGVNSRIQEVQHIGSLVAENKIIHTKIVDPDDIVFGFVGGVGHYKGVHLLVEAFSLLPERYKERSRIEIYGKCVVEYVREIEERFLTGSDIAEKVTFHGAYRPEQLREITNGMDVMVLPSLCADTAPQTIFESYAFGLPIVAPSVGGFPDFIEDEHNGRLFALGSTTELSSILREIVDDPECLASWRDRIPALKGMEQEADDMMKIYSRLV